MKPFATLLALFLATALVQAQGTDPKMTKFINNLMAKMTLEEKIGQFNLITPGWGMPTGSVVTNDVEGKIKSGKVGGMFGVIGVDKIRKVQEMNMANSRLKIPLLFGSDVIHGYKTTFPIPLGLSCSWDPKLVQESARFAGEEASADGLNWAFSPMVDICRDPRWGRIAEGAGEDPYLGSQMSAAMVRGYQGDDLSKNNTIMACVKHFALYGGAEAGRDYNTVDMSRQRMYNEYLPPYEAAVKAGVGSVMSSFNVIDGIPATGNKWLLTDLLRRQWGFKGFVVTDYTSTNEMIDHGMGDLQAVSALALNAGVDMDMVGEGFLTTLQKSLKQGKVTQKQIDDACRRVLEAKYKLGLFDDPYRYCDAKRAETTIMSTANRTAARHTAAQTFVLLKNNNQVLPLKKSGAIALVGPLADSRVNMLGTWAVSGDNSQSVSVLEGFKNALGSSATIQYAKGCNISDDPEFIKRANAFQEEITVDKRTPQELEKEALELAQKSDVVVAVLGESANLTGESACRTDIRLPGRQQAFLDALLKTGKPVVLVLFTGRPLDLTWEDTHVPAILNVWFPGHEAGNAIADVVFGDVTPSGKLSVTFPRSVGQVPVYYNHLNTGRPLHADQVGQRFRTSFLDLPNDPLYPFGYGLSYTQFEYTDFKVSKTQLKGNDKLTATVTVTNKGNYDGAEVVQLYIRDVVGSSSRPVSELKGFQKISLKKGASQTVTFTISPQDLKFYNYNLQYDWEAGDFDIMVGPNSRDVQTTRVNWVKG